MSCAGIPGGVFPFTLPGVLLQGGRNEQQVRNQSASLALAFPFLEAQMFDWLKVKVGKFSDKVKKLLGALPDIGTVLRRADAWANTMKEWGDAGAAWEAKDSRLLQVIKDTADALQVAAPFIGAAGADKLEALRRHTHLAAITLGLMDDAFDKFWLENGRPILEAYLSRSK